MSNKVINNTDMFLRLIKDWLVKNNIGTTNKKKHDISWSIYRAVHDNDINLSDMESIINHVNTNEFILCEGNMWDHLMTYFKNEKYVELFRTIFSLTPCGLATSPNAACGKGELLYRLLRPKSIQPSKGDIIDNYIKKELKGNQVRISSNIPGKQYKEITDKLFKEYIKGNSPKTGGLKGTICFEIEKTQYKEFYEKEFLKIPIDKRLELFKNLLEQLDIDGDISYLSKLITENGFDQEKYQRILLEDWFLKYKKKDNFDELIILGKGDNVKIIKNIEDLNKLKIDKDFFRINQHEFIAWYVI